MAVKQGSAESVEVQLRHRAHPDACDARGRTALMLAAEAGHADVCRVLLEAGADPQLCDQDGLDATALAKACGFQEIVSLLDPIPAEQSAQSSYFQTSPPIEDLPAVAISNGDFDRLFLDDDPLDDKVWEAEPEEAPPPESDQSVLEAAVSAQAQLSAHVPEDLDEDWSDVEIDLPEISELRALERRRREHDEGPTLDLIEAALRLGCCRPTWIKAVAPDVDDRPGSVDAVYVSNLTIALRDLGVLVDDEGFDPPDLADAIAGAPDISEEQEALAREALDFLHCLNSWRANPLNHWWQSVARHAVPTRGQELAYARTMRDGGREGLMGILLSPAAMREVFNAASALTQDELALDEILVLADDPEHAESGAGLDDVNDTDDDALAREETLLTMRRRRRDDFLEAVAELEALHHRHMAEPECADTTLRRMLAILENADLAGPFIARLHQAVRTDTLASEAGHRLALALKKADESRQALILGNLRLVSWVAKKYARWSYTDAIQEGCIGLIKAVEKFDPERGFKFSTYGIWWIRQSITRARDDTSRSIRVPIHVLEKLRKLERAEEEAAFQAEGRSDTSSLAEDLGLSQDAVWKLRRIPEEPLSLSDPNVAAEGIVDNSTTDPEAVAIMSSLKRHVMAAVNTLHPRQKQVVCMRFGLDGYEDHTLEEVGREFCCTRERIRQIEAKALGILKHPARSRALRSFVE